MPPIPPTMKELRDVCATLGITPARSIAETEARIAAYHAGKQDTGNAGDDLCQDEGCPQHGTPHVCIDKGTPTGRLAPSEPEMQNLCDCELSHNGCGMSGRECDCPAGADFASIEQRALAHMVESAETNKASARRIVAASAALGMPYGGTMKDYQQQASRLHREGVEPVVVGVDVSSKPDVTVVSDLYGNVLRSIVPGSGDAAAWRRAVPRQDVGPISRYMSSVETAFLGLSLAHRKGPRRSSTYRAARRNEAKHFRREARDQGAYRVPA